MGSSGELQSSLRGKGNEVGGLALKKTVDQWLGCMRLTSSETEDDWALASCEDGRGLLTLAKQ